MAAKKVWDYRDYQHLGNFQRPSDGSTLKHGIYGLKKRPLRQEIENRSKRKPNFSFKNLLLPMRKLMCEKWKCSSQWFFKHTNHFIKVVCHWANETELLLFLLPRHHWKEIELEKEFMDSASFSFWQLLQRHQGKLSSIRSMKKVIFFHGQSILKSTYRVVAST